MPASRLRRLALGLSLLVLLPSAKADPSIPHPILTPIEGGEPLPGTKLLDWEGDLSAKMVEGAHRFLDQKINASKALRDENWRDVTPAELEAKRARFRLMIGLRDARIRVPKFHRRFSDHFAPHNSIGWTAFADVTGVAHSFHPADTPVADLILLSPPGRKETTELIGRLLARRVRVVVPFTVPRNHETRGIPTREWLNRPAFEFGRHIVGYEVRKILAIAEALHASRTNFRPVAIAGTDGESGMLALFAAAAAEPETFHTVLTGGFFRPLEDSWRAPADHNFFGLLNEFGAAEIAALASPLKIIVNRCPLPGITVAAGGKAKPTVPGDPPAAGSIAAESTRATALCQDNAPEFFDTVSPYAAAPWDALAESLNLPDPDPAPVTKLSEFSNGSFPAEVIEAQIHELDRHTQSLLVPSRKIRDAFMADLNTGSPADFAETQKEYRRIFAEEVIGEFGDPLLPPHPRSRPFQKGPTTTSYEVVLDVFPDLFAYGILTLPDNLEPGEKRPVVVCQHGLEGRPQDTVGEPKFRSYKAFATRLAEAGFITFAPQNLYTGRDQFRLLQFKANPLGRTLFSLMVPQHRQITAWLSAHPNVDPERIAFYGLSYGGKSAMRIPPLVDKYCLSICSADFNEWIWKNTSSDSNYSYVDKNEYEIFEWNLGNTFNYAEMATLIAPRPFMVERGHHDGVAPDEMVAFEYAKVRRLYNARLGIPEKTEIEWFDGPHTINGKGTFKFLHRHLEFEPKPGGPPGPAPGAPGS